MQQCASPPCFVLAVSASQSAATGRAEVSEDRAIDGITIQMPFGMPLDSQRESGTGRNAYGLYQPVLANRFGDKPRAKLRHALHVERIDFEAAVDADRGCDPR
jgi:hypothetical protein